MLLPTPLDRLLDDRGRPSFLWDCDVTLEVLKGYLESEAPEERAYWMGKTMRQARPDDALTLIPATRMVAHWCALERYLGDRRPFWRWLIFEQWGHPWPED